MRVPTLQTSRDSLALIQERRDLQTKLQGQIGSGLRVRAPGDDPVAAAQSELARSRLAHIAQDQRATQLATSALNAADGALAQGVELLESASESLVAAGNGAYSIDERRALAMQLRSTRDSLLSLANTGDGAGGYVFGGQGSLGQPMGGSVPNYAPAAGMQRVGEDGRYATTMDGRDIFLAVPQGNGVFVAASAAGNGGAGWIGSGTVSDATQLTGHDYSITLGGAPGALTYTVTDVTAGTTLASNVAYAPGAAIDIDGQRVIIGGVPAAGDSFALQPAGKQSVFRTLDDAIALLEDGTVGNAQYTERLERVQTDLAGALDTMLLARSRAGEELRRVGDAATGNELLEIDNESRRSDLRDLDLASGISDLQNNQATLEAALQSYASLSRKSLFDLIS